MATARTAEEVLKNVIDVGIALSSEPDLDRLLDRVLAGARAVTQAEAGTLFVRDGSVLRFAAVQNDALGRRLGETAMKRRFATEPLALDRPSLASYVAHTGEALNIEDAAELPSDAPYRFNPDLDRRYGYRSQSFLVVPLGEASGRVLGVLELINAQDARGQTLPFDPAKQPVVELLASQASVALGKAQLEQMSFRDPLTDVPNRRYLTLRLREELKRSERFNFELSMAMFDIDRFKHVNDRWGHRAGDEVLQQLAGIITHQSREYTVIARYGGDEFVALLPNTPKAEAQGYGDRLARLVERYPFARGRVTVSVGVASFPEDARSEEGLLEAADIALYRAKQAGGNTVAVSKGSREGL